MKLYMYDEDEIEDEDEDNEADEDEIEYNKDDGGVDDDDDGGDNKVIFIQNGKSYTKDDIESITSNKGRKSVRKSISRESSSIMNKKQALFQVQVSSSGST